MARARDRADFVAVEEVEGDNATSTAWGDPREDERVRVEDGLGVEPAVRRRGVDVEVPELPDANRLGNMLALESWMVTWEKMLTSRSGCANGPNSRISKLPRPLTVLALLFLPLPLLLLRLRASTGSAGRFLSTSRISLLRILKNPC